MYDNPRRNLEDKMKNEGRLPPGQSATLKFPVLHYGPVPHIDVSKWSLRAYGLVQQETAFTWEEFQQLPATTITCDIHCVTRWSKFDTVWEGVLFRDFVARVGLKPSANYVIFHAEHGFTSNLPLEVAMGDDVLLAYKYDGKLLEPDHGFPVRSLVPQKYFWKSAKWIHGVEFTSEDQLGFWEQAGYHNNADPFEEQRYTR